MICVNRVFHPVGQGAYYEEVFKNIDKRLIGLGGFRTVYDCGSVNKKILRQVINKKEEGVIDILFISHFDLDHVCGIPHLCARNTIKTVVLPLLDNNSRIVFFLDAIHRKSSLDVLALIVDPIKYFMEYCEGNPVILSVAPLDESRRNYTEEVNKKPREDRPYSDKSGWLHETEAEKDDLLEDIHEEKSLERNEDYHPYIDNRFFENEKDSFEIYEEYFEGEKFIDLLHLPEGHIKIGSGQHLVYKSKMPGLEWKWVPFNFNSRNISSQIEKEIKALLLKYGIHKIDLSWILKNLDGELRTELNNIYKKYNTHITNESNKSNTNSMVVYSGPKNSNDYSVHNYHICCRKYNTINNKPGFLFCGDYNAFNIECFNELQDFYQPFSKHLGGIQIPHHGSIKSYNSRLVQNIPVTVISAGKGSAKHPHPRVLNHLRMCPKRKVAVVTDMPNTICTQEIFLDNLFYGYC